MISTLMNVRVLTAAEMADALMEWGSFYCECDSGYSGMLCEVASTSTASNGLGKSYLQPNIDHEG